MLPPYTPSCSKITSQEYNYRNTTFLLVIAMHTELQPGGGLPAKYQWNLNFSYMWILLIYEQSYK